MPGRGNWCFRIEAEAVARLQHPNIVQIHEVGKADGHPFCALEFVAGATAPTRRGATAAAAEWECGARTGP